MNILDDTSVSSISHNSFKTLKTFRWHKHQNYYGAKPTLLEIFIEAWGSGTLLIKTFSIQSSFLHADRIPFNSDTKSIIHLLLDIREMPDGMSCLELLSDGDISTKYFECNTIY